MATIANLMVTIGGNISGLTSSMKQAQGQIKSFGSSMRTAGSIATVGLTLPIVGAGAAIIKAGMDFEAGMSNIKAVTGASTGEMKQFHDLALKMGKDTTFSASEAASGIEELAKAGVSTTDIIHGGLAGALALASAGSIDLASAAEIASTALNAFKSDNLSVMQAADLLAGAANASATDVGEMKFALSSVGSVASSVGLSFKDTSTALAEFAQNGLKGQDAGTSLKTMLMNLVPQSKQQIALFQKLGLLTAKGTSAFFDQTGKLKNLRDISSTLQKSMANMTDEQRFATMQTLFGTDAIRAANILYKEGADGVDTMYEAMSKVTAVQVAATKMDNLKGSIEQLKGSVETAAIKLYEMDSGPIRSLVDHLTTLVNKFMDLPPHVQQTIVLIGLLAAAIGPALLIIGGMSTGISALVTAFVALTSPIGLIITAAALLTAGFIYLWNTNESFRNSIIAITNDVIDFKDKALLVLRDVLGWVKDKSSDLGNSIIWLKDTVVKDAKTVFTDFTNTIKEHKTAIEITAGVLGTIFGPALIATGIQAIATGATITTSFIASLISAGSAALINAAIVTDQFIISMVKASAQAVLTGATMIISFIAAIIKSGVEAAIAAAVITTQMIVALVSYAVQGWLTVAAITAQTVAWTANKVGVVAGTVAMVAMAVATAAQTVATAALTAGQWLLNVALDANPIGVVIIAITALGAAVYAIIHYWTDITNAITTAWNWLTKWNGTSASNKSATMTTYQNTVTSTTSAPVIPHAAGGVFTKPTLLGNHLFGEKGPEAIVPLNKYGGTNGSNGSQQPIIIYLDGTKVYEGVDKQLGNRFVALGGK